MSARIDEKGRLAQDLESNEVLLLLTSKQRRIQARNHTCPLPAAECSHNFRIENARMRSSYVAVSGLNTLDFDHIFDLISTSILSRPGTALTREIQQQQIVPVAARAKCISFSATTTSGIYGFELDAERYVPSCAQKTEASGNNLASYFSYVRLQHFSVAGRRG